MKVDWYTPEEFKVYIEGETHIRIFSSSYSFRVSKYEFSRLYYMMYVNALHFKLRDGGSHNVLIFPDNTPSIPLLYLETVTKDVNRIVLGKYENSMIPVVRCEVGDSYPRPDVFWWRLRYSQGSYNRDDILAAIHR